MNNAIVVCGLFERALVEAGLMKEGRCRDCIHYDGWKDKDQVVSYCSKFNKTLDKEKEDCPDWVIDTR